MDLDKNISAEANSDPENVAELEAGALGMNNGEHRDEIDLSGKKFYVMGRGRYKAMHYEASDNDRDWRNNLPLDFYSFFDYFNSDERTNSFKNAWNGLKNHFSTLAPRGPANRKEERIKREFQKVWKTMVKDNLEAHNGLVTSIEHEPNMHREGYFCYDVKLCRLMGKKKSKDLDINRDLTKTRALEILRILHTRIQTLPKEFVNALFRGPKINGRYVGLFKDNDWPENDADEPFSENTDKDFQYRDDFVDEDGGPIFLIRKNTRGHVILEMRKDQAPASASSSSSEDDEDDEDDGDKAAEAAAAKKAAKKEAAKKEAEEAAEAAKKAAAKAAKQTIQLDQAATLAGTANTAATTGTLPPGAKELIDEAAQDSDLDEQVNTFILKFKKIFLEPSKVDQFIDDTYDSFKKNLRTKEVFTAAYDRIKPIKDDSLLVKSKNPELVNLVNKIIFYVILIKNNIKINEINLHGSGPRNSRSMDYLKIIDDNLDQINNNIAVPLKIAQEVWDLAAGSIANELYDLLCGGQSKNKFGSKLELSVLDWRSLEDSHLGLYNGREGEFIVFAHVFGKPEHMRTLTAGLKSFYVWVPPQGLGRADGYFSNADTDYNAILPWALHYNAKIASKGLTSPKNNEEILMYKLLGGHEVGGSAASVSGSKNEYLDVEDYGRRGGHFLHVNNTVE